MIAKAPAKLIISGEHSVVYGKPALALAINKYANIAIEPSIAKHVCFDFTNLNYTNTVSIDCLEAIMVEIEQKYQSFRRGLLNIKEVLSKPYQLIEYAFIYCIKNLGQHLCKNLALAIKTASNIPVGCGMGSSAAMLVSLLHALKNFLPLKISLEDYLAYVRNIENLQHGHSSGLDLFLSIHGGCHYFADHIQSRPLPQIPMQIVNSGKPQTSTGECVNHVATKYKDHKIFEDFAAVTQALDQALQHNDQQMLNAGIQANQELLEYIGVVPEKVRSFIQELKKRQIFAKITGAGATHGANGGAILVMSAANIEDLVATYGYQSMPIHGVTNGVELI